MATLNQELIDKVNRAYANPATRDFLNMVAMSEGTGNHKNTTNNGYDILFRGETFNDFSHFPNKVFTFKDKQGKTHKTTASGRYQILKGTYEDMASRLGLTDFSPATQDKIAIALMIQKGVDFDSANLATELPKISNVWTSLPGSTVGSQYHSQQPIEKVLGWFNESRTGRGAQPVAIEWGGKTIDTPTYSVPQSNDFFFLNQIERPQGGFFQSAMNMIKNKSYADQGIAPWQFYQGNKIAFTSNATPTAEQLQELSNRVTNPDPNKTYGAAWTPNGVVATVVDKDPVTGATVAGVEDPTLFRDAGSPAAPVEDANASSVGQSAPSGYHGPVRLAPNSQESGTIVEQGQMLRPIYKQNADGSLSLDTMSMQGVDNTFSVTNSNPYGAEGSTASSASVSATTPPPSSAAGALEAGPLSGFPDLLRLAEPSEQQILLQNIVRNTKLKKGDLPK